MKSLLKFMIELNIMEPSRCDKALSEFNSFCDNDCKTISDKFAEFNESSCRLAEFYFEKIGIQKYGELSIVIRHILNLSHGQASVERGFSISNVVLETNMLPETVLSKRIVRDNMITKGLQPHTIKIDKPVMLAAKGARQKYTLYLEEQTKIKASNKEARRAVHLSTDINKIKVKCDQFKKAISMMECEFVDCITMAGKKNDMSYVIIGNALNIKAKKQVKS